MIIQILDEYFYKVSSTLIKINSSPWLCTLQLQAPRSWWAWYWCL